MSYIQKWGYINRVFEETSRGKVVFNMFSFKEFKKRRYYWGLLFIYLFVSAFSLWFSQTHIFYASLAVCATALCLYPLLEKRLSIDLKEVYEPYGLNDHPILMRPRYLHFINFKERLIREKIVNPADVEPLLHWDEIKNEKVSMSVFFQSKIFLIFFTGIVGLLVKLVVGANLDINQIAFLIYVATVFIWLFWAIFDLSQIPHRKRLDLNRFLKWYSLECE